MECAGRRRTVKNAAHGELIVTKETWVPLAPILALGWEGRFPDPTISVCNPTLRYETAKDGVRGNWMLHDPTIWRIALLVISLPQIIAGLFGCGQFYI